MSGSLPIFRSGETNKRTWLIKYFRFSSLKYVRFRYKNVYQCKHDLRKSAKRDL